LTIVSGLIGFRSGVTSIIKKTVVAIGTNGADISYDHGKTWKQFGNANLNAVASKGEKVVWAVGSKGVVFLGYTATTLKITID
jgi:hypothetical protein